MKTDMASLSSMRDFAQRIQKTYPRLDVLINNAATVPPTRTTTIDGLETQFAVNVLSYFFLMFTLSSFLRRSGHARVINVASNLAGDLDLSDMQFNTRKYNNMLAYKQCKQADRQLSWAGTFKCCSFPPFPPSFSTRHSTLPSLLPSLPPPPPGAKFFADSGVKVFAMHPGVTTSAILKGLGYEKGWDSAEFCAKTAVLLATAEDAGEGEGGGGG